jgi:hypothetical protein
MTQAPPEEIGRELSDLAFGIVSQNWLEEHVGKAVDLKGLTQDQINTAEWEFTYLVLFAITNGCGTFSAAAPERTTAVLKAFHATLLRHIAERAGQDIASAHEKNLPSRYRLYAQTIEGEDKNGPYRRLGEAAAIQMLGGPIEDPQTFDNFRETIKVIFTEVRDAAIKTMG